MIAVLCLEFGAYRATKLLPPAVTSQNGVSVFNSKLPADKIQQAQDKAVSVSCERATLKSATAVSDSTESKLITNKKVSTLRGIIFGTKTDPASTCIIIA